MAITNTDKWWSAAKYPNLQDIFPTENPDIENPTKALAMYGEHYMYVGVDSYIIRYDVRDWSATKVGKVTKNPRWDWGAEDITIIHLEMDGNTLYYVVQPNTIDLDLDYVHKKGKGSFDVTAIPINIIPDFEFQKYDKGFRVRSKRVVYDNYRLVPGTFLVGTTSWDTEGIGWGTPAPFKEGGMPQLTSISTHVDSRYPVSKGDTAVLVEIDWSYDPGGDPFEEHQSLVGTEMWISGYITVGVDEVRGHTMWCGKCLNIEYIPGVGVFKVNFVNPMPQDMYITGTPLSFIKVQFGRKGVEAQEPPDNNIFIPTFMDVEVKYERNSMDDRPAETVRVENKYSESGVESFYYPSTVANLDTGDKFKLEPGFHSFISSITPVKYLNKASLAEALGGRVSPFYIDFKWIDTKQQYALADNLFVANDVFSIASKEPTNVLWFNDFYSVLWSHDDSRVEAHGNIYIYKEIDTGNIYVLVNEVNESISGDEAYYTTVRIGKYNTVTGRLTQIFYDRNDVPASEKYLHKTPSYIGTGLSSLDGVIYGTRRSYDRNWKNTNMVVGWAAPPQDDRPADWIGGYSASFLLQGAHSSEFEVMGKIRTERDKRPFTIVESKDVTAQLTNFGFMGGYDTFPWPWMNVKDNYTYLLVQKLRNVKYWPTLYNSWGIEQHSIYLDEVLRVFIDQTIEVARGWDIRDSIFYIEGLEWIRSRTLQFSNTDVVEGQDDALNPYQDLYTAEYDDDWTESVRFKLEYTDVSLVRYVIFGNTKWEPIDKTDTGDNIVEMGIPDVNECFFRTNEGEDFNECYVYVNPIYLGQEFEVGYNYYPVGTLGSIYNYDGVLYANFSTDKATYWYKRVGFASWVRDTIVATTDNTITSSLVQNDSNLYAITGPSFAIRQYSKDWGGCIEQLDTNRRGWDILGQLSGVGDLQLFEWNGIYTIQEDFTNSRGSLDNIISIKKDYIQPYDSVSISYPNGKYETIAHHTDNTYSRTLTYISDYTHAKIIGDSIIDFYNSNPIKYIVLVDDYRYDIRFNDTFTLHDGSIGTVVDIELLGSGQTKLVLYGLSGATPIIGGI